MIPQPGRPRNVPEALTGPEDEKNSFRAEKEQAGKAFPHHSRAGKLAGGEAAGQQPCGVLRAGLAGLADWSAPESRAGDKKIPEGTGPSGKSVSYSPRSCRAATEGSSLPSSSSREAPPPVEM